MRILHPLAIVLTALSMSAGMAHVLEMRAKLGMTAEVYRVTQQIYRGWAFTGIVLFAALAATTVLAFRLRGGGSAFRLTAGAAGAITASLVVFFAATFPVNRITRNWTVLPDDWEQLRRRWEYSHAAGATCLLIALILLAIAATVDHAP